jgi:hypothetical protein
VEVTPADHQQAKQLLVQRAPSRSFRTLDALQLAVALGLNAIAPLRISSSPTCSSLQSSAAKPANRHVRLPEFAENKPVRLPTLSESVSGLFENCLQTSVCARII